MTDQATASSTHEVLVVEPVIRRVVAARAANPADVDDLVQDCLERLLVARARLAPEAVLPYAVVTARNLVSSHAKSALRHTATAPRILDVTEPERPEELLLAGEARRAMTAALAQLSLQERSEVLAYYDDVPVGGEAASDGSAAGRSAPGAVRVRMARTRAKLRLEYLLAFRHLELPTPACRRVLLAISAGDTRRQREAGAGQHLLDCETCAVLSEPLDRRSVALTAIAVPVALVRWVLGKARVHPWQTAGSVAAGSAVVAGAALLLPAHRPAARPAPAPVSSPAASPAAAVIGHLVIGGRAVSDAAAAQSLRSVIGDAVRASGVSVETTVTRNGFWIGTAQARIWVQLVGPLRPLRIHAGDRVAFDGRAAGNAVGYPASVGLTGPGDVQLLTRQGVHLTVETTKISVAR